GRQKKPRPVVPEPQQDLFDRVAGDIARCSLEGSSVYLREVATAEKYETSRAAIRNIFNRLTGAGMLEHIPRRGWRVRAFHPDDLQAFLEVREVLELKALELAWPNLKDEDIREILCSNILPKSDSDRPQIDDSLHAYII